MKLFGAFGHILVSRYLRIDWAVERMESATKLTVVRRNDGLAFRGFKRELFFERIIHEDARSYSRP